MVAGHLPNQLIATRKNLAIMGVIFCVLLQEGLCTPGRCVLERCDWLQYEQAFHLIVCAQHLRRFSRSQVIAYILIHKRKINLIRNISSAWENACRDQDYLGEPALV